MRSNWLYIDTYLSVCSTITLISVHFHAAIIVNTFWRPAESAFGRTKLGQFWSITEHTYSFSGLSYPTFMSSTRRPATPGQRGVDELGSRCLQRNNMSMLVWSARLLFCSFSEPITLSSELIRTIGPSLGQ
jgi:hypothetical protein